MAELSTENNNRLWTIAPVVAQRDKWVIDQSKMKAFPDEAYDDAIDYQLGLERARIPVVQDYADAKKLHQNDATVAYHLSTIEENPGGYEYSGLTEDYEYYDNPDYNPDHPYTHYLEIYSYYPSEEAAKADVKNQIDALGSIDYAPVEIEMAERQVFDTAESKPMFNHIENALRGEYTDYRQRFGKYLVNTAVNDVMANKEARNAYLPTETNSPSDNYLAQQIYLKGRKNEEVIENQPSVISMDNIDIDKVMHDLKEKTEVYDKMTQEDREKVMPKDTVKLIEEQLLDKVENDPKSIIPSTVTEDYLRDQARFTASSQIEYVPSEQEMPEFDRTFDEALQAGDLHKVGMTKKTIKNGPLGQAYEADVERMKAQESDIDLSDLPDNSLEK